MHMAMGFVCVCACGRGEMEEKLSSLDEGKQEAVDGHSRRPGSLAEYLEGHSISHAKYGETFNCDHGRVSASPLTRYKKRSPWLQATDNAIYSRNCGRRLTVGRKFSSTHIRFTSVSLEYVHSIS
jgi:hypothetical protein